MKLRRALWTLPPLMCLGACGAVGPDYHLPKQALINQPLASRTLVEKDDDPHAQQGIGEAATDAPVPSQWWRLYDDPVLNGLIQQALISNTDLRVAAGNLARSNAILGVAEAQGGLSGNVSMAVKRAQESAESYLETAKLPVMNEGDLGLAVSYQFDLFGTLKRGVEAAGANMEAVRAAGDVARITVVANVARAYVENCDASEEEEIALRSLALQQRSTDLAKRLRDVGRGAQPNVTRSVTQVETIRAQLPQFAARRRIAHYELAALLAVDPDQLPKAIDACHRAPRIASPLPVGNGAALLRRRPDVREAERRLASATAEIGVAVGALYPNVSFGVSAGTSGIAGDLFQPATNRWGFGPLISWTIPANGTRSRIREAHIGADIALAQFDGVVLNALRETQSRLATYAGDLGRMDALHDAQRSAQQSADQTHRFYLAGRESFLDDLDAQRTLTSVNAQVSEAEGKVAQDQINVFLALGGGWEMPAGSGKTAASSVVPGAAAPDADSSSDVATTAVSMPEGTASALPANDATDNHQPAAK